MGQVVPSGLHLSSEMAQSSHTHVSVSRAGVRERGIERRQLLQG